jgi:hydrogenase expression/formation protein HypD
MAADVRDRSAELAGRLGRPVQIMEICGTHTVSISRSGLRTLVGDQLRLISGPGCPVCVTDQGYIDLVLDLALSRPDITIATYGDMVRVPGVRGNLADARAKGAEVAVVYAAHQAVALAAERPGRDVVFLGIGFETTAPATALAVRDAKARGLTNFSVLTTHKLVLPAMHVLLSDPSICIDGFLCPGHVSVILGYDVYQPVVDQHRRPCVVAGFEPQNVAAALVEILREMQDDAPKACTVYPAVTAGGNAVAQQILNEVFTIAPARWRALGEIPGSGLVLNDEYAAFDAARKYGLVEKPGEELPGCLCGQVITGRAIPTDCPLFGRKCTPRNPIGPCMVSSEGSCSAYFKYHRHERSQ